MNSTGVDMDQYQHTVSTVHELQMITEQTVISIHLETASALTHRDLGNDLLPDGTKPLPEPMLTHHQYTPLT